jgi:hypothetical protein
VNIRSSSFISKNFIISSYKSHILLMSHRTLESYGTSVCSASKFCSRNINGLWFKSLARMKFRTFITVLVTCFIFKTILQSTFCRIIQWRNNIFQLTYFTDIILHLFQMTYIFPW